MLASAPLFPKFVADHAAMYHELRKRGTSLLRIAAMKVPPFPQAVLFDLLSALLNSWTIWDAAAGSQARGRAWRASYLRLTYGCGSYRPYEELVRAAAE